MYIGEKEIKATFPDGEKDLKVELADGGTIIINKELFDLIKSEKKGEGDITDHVRDYFARKFVTEMAYYGLTYAFVSVIGNGMDNIIWNLRENAIKKAFDCPGSTEIKLISLFESEIDEEKLDK